MADEYKTQHDLEPEQGLLAVEPGRDDPRESSDMLESVDGGEALAAQRSPESQYCVFRAGRERFCLSVLTVEEVVDWPPITRVPLGPSFLMGVFNLRGSIVPLIDIAFTEGRRAGLSPRHVVVAALLDDAHPTCLRFGIAADEVIGTYTAADDALLDQMPSDVPHCRGMLRHDDRLALVLDLPKMVEVFPVPVI